MFVTGKKSIKNIFSNMSEETLQKRGRVSGPPTSLFFLFFTLSFVFHFQVLAAPTTLTYQGRILKADGTPLEYNNVGFIFQITNSSGGCILYQEQVTGYDMTNSGGVFDVPIGEGTISYPLGGGFTVTDTFNNSSTFTCGSCSGYSCVNGSGTYSPAVNDGRRLRVQFYDGSGWRAISPDNVIRSVPFAAYSMSAQKLGNKVVEDFLLKAGLPTCGAGTFLTWNGTTMSCASVTGASGGTVTDVTSANSYLSVANGTSTPTLTLNVGTSAGTVAAGNDSRITGALQTGAAAGGSLSGTYPNPGIANNAVTSATINDGAVTTTKALTTNPGINRIVGTDGTTGASLAKMECSTVGHVLSWTVATGFQCNAISSLYTAPVTSVAGKTGAVSLVSADISDATDANTGNMLVKRDASGNFSAGTISGTGLVVGTLKVTGGTPATGKVLTSDATGNATWQNLTASQWTTSGSDIYYNSGNVGIGTTAPKETLEVTGGLAVGQGPSYGLTTLSGAVALADTTISVGSTAEYPSKGTLYIDLESLTYSGKTATTFTGITRGVQGTSAATHSAGTSVNLLLAKAQNSSTTSSALAILSDGSATIGKESTATSGSVSLGYGNSASGTFSIALGNNNMASGPYSIAGGTGNMALSTSAIALGAGTSASGPYSTALGFGSAATMNYATALGNSTNASGTSSTALGNVTYASGTASTAMGMGTIATAYDTAIGRFNVGNGSTLSWVATDPLFEIGIGTSTSARANAMTVLKNGNVGIGTTNPTDLLTIVGNSVRGQITVKSYSSNQYDSAGILIHRSRGKVSSPSYVLANDRIGHFLTQDGTTPVGSSAAGMEIYASEDHSATAQGSSLNFTVVPNGTTGAIAAVKINQNGNVGIGTSAPAATLDINGTAKLKKYAAEPNACDATHDGQLALTSVYTTCVCNGTSWVKTSDGSSVCIWL